MRRSLATRLASLSLLLASASCVGGATPYPPSAREVVDAGVGAASQDGSAETFDAAAPPPAGDAGPDFVSDADVADAMDGAADADATDAALDDGSVVDADLTDADLADADLADASAADADTIDPDAGRPGPDGPPEILPREP
jgi:hypothetical protein